MGHQGHQAVIKQKGARMSRDYYAEINLHLIWHTKCSRPMITPEMERSLYPMIQRRIEKEGWFHHVGGTATHIHAVASIPPRC